MVLNMPRYSYNNIIIAVNNDIILEILSARIVHPGAATILSFFLTRLEYESNKGCKLLINFSF